VLVGARCAVAVGEAGTCVAVEAAVAVAAEVAVPGAGVPGPAVAAFCAVCAVGDATTPGAVGEDVAGLPAAGVGPTGATLVGVGCGAGLEQAASSSTNPSTRLYDSRRLIEGSSLGGRESEPIAGSALYVR
jgi:hypothetical protein